MLAGDRRAPAASEAGGVMADAQTVARRGSSCTEAELRVIDVMRQYVTEAECARRLGLSQHTVHAHLRNARSRLGVRTTRELLATVFA